MRPRRSASSQSCGPHPVVAGGGRIALVEDQVDDRKHRRQPGGELVAARDLEGDASLSASVRLARTMRWAIVGSGTRKARAISSVVRPPSRRSVSATRASVESTGWQAVNIEAQEIVADVVVERGVEIGLRRLLLDLELVAELLVLAFEQLVAAEADRWRDAWRAAMSQAPGLSGMPDLGPLLERRDERVLREVLGEADVAHDSRETGDELRRLDPPDRVDGAMCIGSRHGYRSHTLYFASASRVISQPPAPRGLGRISFSPRARPI